MARELMPKSGIMMPYVVINRDAAVVGVSTVDGQAGAINLTGKYLQKTDAADTYQTKTDGASKTYVLDSIQPIMEGALFKADPFVDNNVPFRSAGANGVESVDMIKVTPENTIKLGSYASSVQGVEIHSAGRLQVVDQSDAGVETKYPVYSKRYRPEIEDLPFAAIGTYVKDSKGRTIGVNRTGINSDIKQFTQKVTFQQPVTVADAVGDYDAVTLRQLRNSGGGSGGPTMSGISNFNIGDFRLVDSRAFIQANDVVADGQLLNRADYPELWAYAQMLTPISDADWVSTPENRGKYSLGDGTTTFRVPDRNGVQKQGVGGFTGPNSITALYARGDAGDSSINGTVSPSGVPNITGSITINTDGNTLGLIGGATGAFAVGEQSAKAVASNSTTTGAANRARVVDFNARFLSDIYGRTTTEVRTNTFFGVWVIRAKGAFIAANTSWAVINQDTTLPGSGTTINGGELRSQYLVGGEAEAQVSLRANGEVGGTYVGRMNVFNKTKNVTQVYDFTDGGAFVLPSGGSIRSGNMKFDFSNSTNEIYVSTGKLRISSTEPGTQTLGMSVISGTSRAKDQAWFEHWGNSFGGGADKTRVSVVELKIGSSYASYSQLMADGTYQTRFAGSVYATVNPSSDIRIKENVQRIDNPLDKMKLIKGVSWNLKTTGNPAGYGFVAQDVETVFPDAVKNIGETELVDGTVVEDTKAVDTYGVAAALHHEAILELMKQIEDLKKEVAELKSGK
ncbi:tail fiber protein [Escherichia phage vB_EcoP_IMEP8]|uniref:Tail fiber protein n=1 Tax=Escherichia phage vB_EcoP_IMEP8 TaxID=2866663 RepID=A0AAE8Y393_9CAUD|nr:tail fiber protein [Escherichia phage vB_EcoP_IMEP8]UCR91933.1 putative tail fiber protein [Escherichia phage vB_EcoP_IMEP8]